MAQITEKSAAAIRSRIQNREEQEREADPGTVSTAELAECTCPEFCERDHDTD